MTTDEKPTETESNKVPTADGAEVKDPSRTFTQSDIDEMITARLAKANKTWETRLQAQQMDYETKLANSKLTEQERLKAEQQQAVDALKRENAELKRAGGVAKLSAALSQMGAPAELADYLYTDDEAAEALRLKTVTEAWQKAVKTAADAQLARGAPKAPTASVPKSAMEDSIDRAMGIKRPPRQA